MFKFVDSRQDWWCDEGSVGPHFFRSEAEAELLKKFLDGNGQSFGVAQVAQLRFHMNESPSRRSGSGTHRSTGSAVFRGNVHQSDHVGPAHQSGAGRDCS